jgi:PAS domain S-box-containing protein
VVIFDYLGRYFDANESFCRIMRTTRDRVIGASFLDFIPPGRLDEATRELARLRTGGTTSGDFPLQAADGSILELEWTSSPQFLPGLSCCACRDVTERKRAERALRAREEEARTLLAALPDIVSRFDRDLRFVYMSPAVERSTGLPPEHFAGKTHMEAGLPDDLSDLLRASLKRIFDTGLQDTVEFDMMAPGGARHFIGIGVPEFGPEGDVTSVLSIVRDITERKRSDEALRAANVLLTKANADLEQFAYSASHDLREPIRMVSLYTQLLKKKYHGRLDHQADQYIDFAVEGAHRMNLMIDDLLAYTRSSAHSDQPVPRISANTALQNAIHSLRPAIEESGATITFDDLPSVAIHPVKLEQIFQNLISNAMKYRSKAAPAIHVGARREDDGFIFSVADNGIGIDDVYADHIFGLFKRLHTAGEYPGTGMGLAICRNIVERYGGRIWVHSIPGQGSTFFFTIPDRQ